MDGAEDGIRGRIAACNCLTSKMQTAGEAVKGENKMPGLFARSKLQYDVKVNAQLEL